MNIGGKRTTPWTGFIGAEEIISVQPMTAPVGGLKWYKERYKSSSNDEQLRLFSSSWYEPSDDPNNPHSHLIADRNGDIQAAIALASQYGFSSHGKNKFQAPLFQHGGVT